MIEAAKRATLWGVARCLYGKDFSQTLICLFKMVYWYSRSTRGVVGDVDVPFAVGHASAKNLNGTRLLRNFDKYGGSDLPVKFPSIPLNVPRGILERGRAGKIMLGNAVCNYSDT